MKNKRNIIIASFLLVLFIVLTILVVIGAMKTIDLAVYNFVAKLINDGNTPIFKIITFFGSSLFITVLVIILLVILTLKKSRRGVEIASVMILSTVLNNVLKLLVKRPRPDILQLVTETGYSFPSGHTMAITTLGLFLIYLLEKGSLNKNKRRILSLFIVLVILMVMLSRIYLGVHYFSDVLGGFIISSLLVLLFVNYLEKKNYKK